MVCTGVVRSWLRWYHQHKSLLLLPLNKKSNQSTVNQFINSSVQLYSPHAPPQHHQHKPLLLLLLLPTSPTTNHQ
jgi:hypothetical protein